MCTLIRYGTDAIGGGKFQTKEQLEERKKAGEGLRSMMGNSEMSEEQVRVSENLNKVAKELGVGIQAVALAYVQQKVPYVFPIVYVLFHFHESLLTLFTMQRGTQGRASTQQHRCSQDHCKSAATLTIQS